MENCSRCGLPLDWEKYDFDPYKKEHYRISTCIEVLKAELARVSNNHKTQIESLEAQLDSHRARLRNLSDPVVDPRNSAEPFKEPLP